MASPGRMVSAHTCSNPVAPGGAGGSASVAQAVTIARNDKVRPSMPVGGALDVPRQAATRLATVEGRASERDPERAVEPRPRVAGVRVLAGDLAGRASVPHVHAVPADARAVPGAEEPAQHRRDAPPVR